MARSCWPAGTDATHLHRKRPRLSEDLSNDSHSLRVGLYLNSMLRPSSFYSPPLKVAGLAVWQGLAANDRWDHAETLWLCVWNRLVTGVFCNLNLDVLRYLAPQGLVSQHLQEGSAPPLAHRQPLATHHAVCWLSNDAVDNAIFSQGRV